MRKLVRVAAFVAAAGAVAALGGGIAFAGWVNTSPQLKVKKLKTVAMPTFTSGPAVELTRAGNVKVDWIGQKIVKGVNVERYIVARHNVTTGAKTQVCGDTVTATKCTDVNVPAGQWNYTVRTVHYKWIGSESDRSGAVTIEAPAAQRATNLVPGQTETDATTAPSSATTTAPTTSPSPSEADEPTKSAESSDPPADPPVEPEETATTAPEPPADDEVADK